MTEQIASAWEALSHFLTSKITSFFVAGGVIVGAQTAQPQFINIAESGFLWFTYAHWMTIIGCVWIMLLILEKIGVFKLIKWAWQKVFGDAR